MAIIVWSIEASQLPFADGAGNGIDWTGIQSDPQLAPGRTISRGLHHHLVSGPGAGTYDVEIETCADLAGQVDGAAALAADPQVTARYRTQRRIDDPAVDLRHQLVAVRGAQEVRRLGLAAAARQADKHLYGRTGIGAAAHRDDRLHGKLEGVVVQGRLQFPQPADVAAVPRDRLVPRRIDVDFAAPFLLGDVTCRIRGTHHVLHVTADVADLDEADRYADIEDLVFPYEAVVGDRVADVHSDLPRLVDRAADQQRAELVATQATHEVGITDLVLDQRGYLAKHVVTGKMPATVVHGLESIEVHVEQHVDGFVGVCGIHRFVETALEFTPVDQAGQRIVRRLVAHLAGQTAQFSHIVKNDDGARDTVARPPNR